MIKYIVNNASHKANEISIKVTFIASHVLKYYSTIRFHRQGRFELTYSSSLITRSLPKLEGKILAEVPCSNFSL